MVRIMVVEDDADLAGEVTDLLRSIGHEVLATGNAGEDSEAAAAPLARKQAGDHGLLQGLDLHRHRSR